MGKKTKVLYVAIYNGKIWGAFSSLDKADYTLKRWFTVESPELVAVEVDWRFKSIPHMLGEDDGLDRSSS